MLESDYQILAMVSRSRKNRKHRAATRAPRQRAGAGGHLRRVSATEVSRNFSEMINRVRYNRETLLVERGGVSVCEIKPVYEGSSFTGSDLVDLLKSLPPPGEEYLDAVESGIKSHPKARETRWRR
jgi:hypothetical protein